MGLEQSGAERRSCPPVGWLSLMSLDERRCVFSVAALRGGKPGEGVVRWLGVWVALGRRGHEPRSGI